NLMYFWLNISGDDLKIFRGKFSEKNHTLQHTVECLVDWDVPVGKALLEVEVQAVDLNAFLWSSSEAVTDSVLLFVLSFAVITDIKTPSSC
ncbi:hypothetical protein STEG23_017604, partial [Scotinomys teguina]